MRSASLLRIFRLVKLTRAARLFRLLRFMPELMMLLKGLTAASRSVMCTLFFMGLLIYVFGILLTSISRDTPVHALYFGTVGESMGNLLICSMFPDSFDLINELGLAGIFIAICFIIFLLLGSVTVMNLLVGVVVEVVSVTAAVEKEKLDVDFVKNHLLRLIHENDSNADNSISGEEFENLLSEPSAVHILQGIGVDPVSLVDMADFIFEDQTSLSFGDFMEVVLQLRGQNQASVKDVLDLHKYIREEMEELAELLMKAIYESNSDRAKRLT